LSFITNLQNFIGKNVRFATVMIEIGFSDTITFVQNIIDMTLLYNGMLSFLLYYKNSLPKDKIKSDKTE
jgi:hypothetical protein